MPWPSSILILEIILRSSAALLLGLVLDRAFVRHTRFRDALWPITFFAVALAFVPLPILRLPLIEKATASPDLGEHVYELDPGFSLGRITYSNPGVSFVAIVAAVAVGVGLAALAMQIVRSWKLVKASQQVTDEDLVQLTYDVSERAGLSDAPHVVLTDELQQPAIVGLLTPALVMPVEFLSMDNEVRRLIATHEIGHIARRDTLRLALFSAVRAVLWWNPLVWAAFRRAVVTMEECNDERCLEMTPDRSRYVRLLASRLLPRANVSAIGFFGQSHVLTRVRTIVDPHGRRPSLAPLASTLFFLPIIVPLSLERSAPADPNRLGLDEMVVASERSLPARLWRMRLDGSDPQPLADTFVGALTASVSPDGTMLAYVKNGRAGQQDIYVARIDGTGERPLVTFPGRNYEPTWSPDGKSLAFGTTKTGTWNIGVVDVETGRSRLATTDAGSNLEPSWHPGGRRIVFSSLRSGQEKIWSMDLDGSHMVQLTPGDWQDVGGAYSHDGRTLGFGSHRLGKYDVYLMDLVTGECRLMSRDLEFDTTSSLFVEADKKVASITMKDGLFQVILVTLSDGSHRFVTSGKATTWATVR